MERADGEWCKLEMNKVAFLPRDSRELCLGRGPLVPGRFLKDSPSRDDKLACCLLRLGSRPRNLGRCQADGERL